MSVGTFLNLFFLVILILFLFWLFIRNKGLMFMLIPIVYVYCWSIISTVYLESGERLISDLQMKSSFNFSAVKLIGYFMVFILAIYISFHSKRGIVSFRSEIQVNELYANEKQCRWIILIAFLIAFFWFLDVVISGNVISNPLLTRFNYWDSYSTIPIVKYLIYFINPISFVLGLIMAKRKERKYKIHCLILIISYFLLSYLIGNQFSALIGLLIYFFIPFLIIHYKDFTKKEKMRALIIFIIMFLIVGYIKIIALTDYGAFVNRFLVLQGDLWFATDMHVTNHGNDFSVLARCFENLFSGGSYEMDYLMRLVMPIKNYTIFKNGNVSLYSGFPAFDIAIFGYFLTFFIVAIEGWIYGKFLKYINRKIRDRDLIVVLFSVYFLVQYNKTFNMCGYSNLFNGIPILSLIFIIIYEFIKRELALKKWKY